jgi:hypothetical protein
MFGAGAGSMQDLTPSRALVEAGDDDWQLRAPQLDSPDERTDSRAPPTTQPDHHECGTGIPQLRDELITITKELQGERGIASAHNERASQGIILPSSHDYAWKHPISPRGSLLSTLTAGKERTPFHDG